MLSKKELENFKSLISSPDMENIELALEIAKGNKIKINELEINQIYQYLIGVNNETLQKSPLSKKIRVLNSWSKINLLVNDGQFNPLLLLHLKNIKELNLKFYSCGIQYVSQFMENIYLLSSLEKLSLKYFPLLFLETSISNLCNLRELDLEGSVLKELPPSITKLKRLESLVLSNTKIFTLPENYSELHGLKKMYIKSTPILEMKSEIEKLLPNCEVILG